MNLKINVHIYHSVLKNDTRIFKEVKSIINLGLADKVIVLGIHAKGLQKVEQFDENIKFIRFRCTFDFLPLKYKKGIEFFFYYIHVLIFVLINKVSYLNIHSLLFLPIFSLLKIIKNYKLIYDAHELETERVNWNINKRKFAKIVERFSIKYVDKVIVVSDSINNWYTDEYALKDIFTLRNISDIRFQEANNNAHNLRDKFNLNPSDIIFIYQGILTKERGILDYLNCFSALPSHYHLVCMGFGVLESTIKEYEQKYSNIHFHPALPPKDILSATKTADIGLIVIHNNGLSYYYSLANKFFEYLTSDIPVIASNFPDMSAIIDKEKCGWYSEPNNVPELRKLILSLNHTIITEKKNNLKEFSNKYSWEKEEIILKKVFDFNEK